MFICLHCAQQNGKKDFSTFFSAKFFYSHSLSLFLTPTQRCLLFSSYFSFTRGAAAAADVDATDAAAAAGKSLTHSPLYCIVCAFDDNSTDRVHN